MRHYLWLVAGAAVMASAAPACAAQAAFDFRFTSQGDDNNGIDVVTGTLYGLASSGSSSPTSVTVQYGGQTFDYMPTGQQINQPSGTFTVVDNNIVASNFFDNFSDPTGGYQLSLNNQSASFQDLYNGKFTDASMGVTYTPANMSSAGTPVGAVPEPATWAMMIGGFAIAGGALRRRPKVKVRGAVVA